MQKRSSQRSTETEHTAGFRKENKMEYTYGMRLRGFSIGCQPMNGLIGREERPDIDTNLYYDIIAYDRELTEEECKEYELDYIGKE